MFYDGNPEIPSVFLKEARGVRMGNILNGLALGRRSVTIASLVIKPITAFQSYVSGTGDLQPIHKRRYIQWWYGSLPASS